MVKNPLALRALLLYIQNDSTPAEIATELGVPVLQVASWMAQGRWVAQRRAIERTLLDEADRRHRLMIAEARIGIAKEQLAMGKMAEGIVQVELKRVADLQAESSDDARGKGSPLNPRMLKELMEALNGATAVRARASALEQKASADANADAAVEVNDRSTYVLNAKPGRPITIDAESEFTDINSLLPDATPEPAQSHPIPPPTARDLVPSDDSKGSESAP